MKLTRAKINRKTMETAGAHSKHLIRLKKLNSRVRGKFRKFMTREDLESMRKADTLKPD
jgi:hypothetical protein